MKPQISAVGSNRPSPVDTKDTLRALSATRGSRRSGSLTRNAIAGSLASGSEPVYCSGNDVQQAINPENDHGLG
jgi:hypothetical protein